MNFVQESNRAYTVENNANRPTLIARKLPTQMPLKQLLKPREVKGFPLVSIRSDLQSRDSTMKIEDSISKHSFTTFRKLQEK